VNLEPADLTERVRRGYDALSYTYRADDDNGGDRRAWVKRLISLLSSGARVLDLGCGCGVPVARDLAAQGFAVTGVDISEVQIDRARRLVPDATFIRADAVDVRFPVAEFDAIISLYTLIHLPLAEQPALLARMAGWLRPGGILLATTGHRAWTGTSENWLGGGAAMWWSHADAATYRRWLEQAGFTVDSEEFVPEGSGGHALFWVHRP
jgi:2-polyprenyl-3-methyl-5-hydroxy-6-metoxy-1,4-benzoquinol methylase